MHGLYRGKDYMKKFSESLREHAIKIINFWKRKMKRAAGIIWKCKNLLYLLSKIWIKIFER